MNKIRISDITVVKIKNGKFKKEIPEFYKLKKVIENNGWHNKETVFGHTIVVLKELDRYIKKISPKIKRYLNQKLDGYARKDLLFLSTIFHDIAKKETLITVKGGTSCPSHEEASSKKVVNILNRFDLTAKEKKIVAEIIKNHGAIHFILFPGNKSFNSEYKRFKLKNYKIYLELMILAAADTARSYLKKTNLAEFNFRMNFYKKVFNQYL